VATLILTQTHRGLSMTWNQNAKGTIEDLSLVNPATGFTAIFISATRRYIGTGTFALLNGGNTQGLPNLSYVPSAADYTVSGETPGLSVGEYRLWIKAVWPDATVDFAGPGTVEVLPQP
jgi:hypothetical protein